MSGTSARFRGPAAEESVACNLIPMIDIMFLLLLFFMLGADMTQRELEEVKLPPADHCVKDDFVATGPGRTTVNVFHAGARSGDSSGVACALHDAGGVCRDPAHWLVAIRGAEFGASESAIRMKDEADASRERGDGSAADAREVMIRADEGAPYAVVQKVIEGCASAGLWKIAVGAAQPTESSHPEAQPKGF
jgi:biopolymer transport protein ExbD